MQLILVGSLLLLAASPAHAERVWLVVGASSASPAVIAEKARGLSTYAPNGLVVQTADCGDTNAMFAWVADIADSPEAAQRVLSHLRENVKDAYVKRCDVKTNSLLAVRMPAVDMSIADVPRDAVNWERRDRVSSAQPLPDGRTLVIARLFVDVPNDPLEGRRERVVLADSAGKRVVLRDHCVDPGRAVTRKSRIAFHCAGEQAGDHLLHTVVVFDDMGKKIVEIDRCRNPRWVDDGVIACEAESVGPDGRLKLTLRNMTVRSSGFLPAIFVSTWPLCRVYGKAWT